MINLRQLIIFLSLVGISLFIANKGQAEINNNIFNSLPNNSIRDDRYTLSIGYQDTNLSFAAGRKFNKYFAIQSGVIFNNNYSLYSECVNGIGLVSFNCGNSSNTVIDSPVPHNDYTDLGKQNLGVQGGLDLLGYIPVNKDISVYGGAGLYYQQKGQVVRSNKTGYLYRQSAETVFTPAYTLGLETAISEGLNLGLGYHSLRGINGTISLGF